MQCSICGAEAEDLTSGEFDGLGVRCRHCGEYRVAEEALNAFLRLDFDARLAALAKAKADAGGAPPTITEACL